LAQTIMTVLPEAVMSFLQINDAGMSQLSL
jgi:hypothetical protein